MIHKALLVTCLTLPSGAFGTPPPLTLPYVAPIYVSSPSYTTPSLLTILTALMKKQTSFDERLILCKHPSS